LQVIDKELFVTVWMYNFFVTQDHSGSHGSSDC